MYNQDRTITEAIYLGSKFIKQQLLSGNYGLSCLGKDGTPKFSNNKGHLFSVFHIANALMEDMTEIERAIFLVRILSEENQGEWGYSPRGYYKETGDNPFFVDSDDTAFALRTLRLLGIYRVNDVLLKYKCVCKNIDYAFTTFVTASKEKSLVTIPDFENNLQIHPEVNANIFHVLLDSNNDHLINEKLIVTSQKSDGSWSSFFYPNSYYPTFQFMSLLKITGKLKYCYDKGMNYVSGMQNANGAWGDNNDVYLSAMALKTLCLNKKSSEQIKKGVDFLLSKIESDGSWLSNQIIWEFYDQDGDVWRAFDENRVITTSVCVEALKSSMV